MFAVICIKFIGKALCSGHRKYMCLAGKERKFKGESSNCEPACFSQYVAVFLMSYSRRVHSVNYSLPFHTQ